MTTNQTVITNKQYREYTAYLDTMYGINHQQIIHRVKDHEMNPELIHVSISGIPSVHILARFYWMFQILQVLVKQEQEVIMTADSAIYHP